jgi:hypothetical protein
MALAPLQALGVHRVTTGDLEAGDHLTLLHAHGPVALIYVDPPWGANWHSGFRHQAGQVVTTAYDAFLAALLAPVPLAAQGALIETVIRSTRGRAFSPISPPSALPEGAARSTMRHAGFWSAAAP